ncbi:hypothetical protein [Blastomonas sp. RAC04]|uniref:hypothetical protein n=1 Tax=Blastomonas sp. RAC04 TaxID=1842535 RepID=UPI00083DE747|nr:hypothetical protein [Blastomonas sp. RAC04]
MTPPGVPIERGILQADAYGGYGKLYHEDRPPAPIAAALAAVARVEDEGGVAHRREAAGILGRRLLLLEGHRPDDDEGSAVGPCD